MITQSELREIAGQQEERIKSLKDIIARDIQSNLTVTPSFARIITGIRRCGKSTLLASLYRSDLQGSFYLNFDNPRLFSFEVSDFPILDKIIAQGEKKKLYFDELQVVNGWELYVRQKLDEGYELTVTGSNATMLSRELGTHLTGRQLSSELFPFSYHEFLLLKKSSPSATSFSRYLTEGGFPEYLKSGNQEIHGNLLDDILHRDIAVRYNIRDIRTLKSLLVYLVSNTGAPVSATKLKHTFGIQSTNTLLEYFSFLEQSYLFSFIPIFSYSLKSQSLKPKKPYCIDTGLVHSVSASSTRNAGRILENAVFLHLRKQFRKIAYFATNQSECDFVVSDDSRSVAAIQVCHELTHENSRREYKGAVDAAKFLNLQSAYVVTANQDDSLIMDGISIEVVPAHRFFIESNISAP